MAIQSDNLETLLKSAQREFVVGGRNDAYGEFLNAMVPDLQRYAERIKKGNYGNYDGADIVANFNLSVLRKNPNIWSTVQAFRNWAYPAITHFNADALKYAFCQKRGGKHKLFSLGDYVFDKPNHKC